MKEQVRPALTILAAVTVLTGLVYPLAMTAVTHLLFPARSEGSLIMRGDTVIGSSLIGQTFNARGVFWSRPSATGPSYNAAASSGSNLGPLNADLQASIRDRVAVLRAANPDETGPVPVDLVTASASGLDPHISPASAQYQVPRVARERGMSRQDVEKLVKRFTEGRQLGILGEPRVNVLELNLALDAAAAHGAVNNVVEK